MHIRYCKACHKDKCYLKHGLCGTPQCRWDYRRPGANAEAMNRFHSKPARIEKKRAAKAQIKKQLLAMQRQLAEDAAAQAAAAAAAQAHAPQAADAHALTLLQLLQTTAGPAAATAAAPAAAQRVQLQTCNYTPAELQTLHATARRRGECTTATLQLHHAAANLLHHQHPLKTIQLYLMVKMI